MIWIGVLLILGAVSNPELWPAGIIGTCMVAPREMWTLVRVVFCGVFRVQLREPGDTAPVHRVGGGCTARRAALDALEAGVLAVAKTPAQKSTQGAYASALDTFHRMCPPNANDIDTLNILRGMCLANGLTKSERAAIVAVYAAVQKNGESR